MVWYLIDIRGKFLILENEAGDRATIGLKIVPRNAEEALNILRAEFPGIEFKVKKRVVRLP